MKLVEVELTGNSPLMTHRFTEAAIMGLLGVKQEKKSVEEVKTPRELAEQHAYKTTDGKYYITGEMISGAIKTVASDYKQKNSGRKSLKGVVGGAILPNEESIILRDLKNNEIRDFEVDLRVATNHKAGAVAVCRPRFDRWKVKFTLSVDDTIIAEKVAHDMLSDAGKRAGIGSYRVAKGGRFGQFRVTSWKVKNLD